MSAHARLAGTTERDARRAHVLKVLSDLAAAGSLDEVVVVLRASARSISGADGITLVARIGDRVRYLAEDSKSPLWAGQDFPIESCISGLAMLENAPILIPDIYADTRVPIEAYAPTFVRSMAMFPIGIGTPRMAMGAYWAAAGTIDPLVVSTMLSITRAAGSAIHRIGPAGPVVPKCATPNGGRRGQA